MFLEMDKKHEHERALNLQKNKKDPLYLGEGTGVRNILEIYVILRLRQ
jgi:hypothetical protein